MTHQRREIGKRWSTVVVLAGLLLLATCQPIKAEGPGFHGRVFELNNQGLPVGQVAGATIEFTSQAGKAVTRVTSDAQGLYKVELQPGAYYFKVSAPGFKDENTGRGLRLQLNEGYAVYNFSLVKGTNDPSVKPPRIPSVEPGKLQGQVRERTPRGELIGIPGATVTARQSAGKPRLARVLTSPPDKESNSAGRYQLALDAAAWKLSATAPGFTTVVDPAPVEIQSGMIATRDFVLVREQAPVVSGQGIRGAVTLSSAGRPGEKLPPVKLSVAPLAEAGRSAETIPLDPAGRFIRDLGIGRYQVVAQAEGFQLASSGPRDVFSGRYTAVNLVLQPLRPAETKEFTFIAKVYERLPGARGKQLLSGATVLVRKPAEPGTKPVQGATDTHGQVTLKLTAAGKYEAVAQKAGFKSATAPAEIIPGSPTFAELLLEREGPQQSAVHLQIVERIQQLERPVPGAHVVISRVGKPVASIDADRQGLSNLSLDPASYLVQVTQSGFSPVQVPLTLADKPANLKVTLQRAAPIEMARLRLNIVEEAAARRRVPARGARVEVSSKGQIVATALTGEDGLFISAALKPGTYHVAVTKQGLKPAAADFVIADKDVARELLIASAAPAMALLTIKVDEGQAGQMRPVRGAAVRISGPSTTSSVTNAEGEFSARLAPGMYTVDVTRDGYRSARLQTTVGTNDVTQKVNLQRNR